MKKNNSNLKDYLYDSMDYIIVLLIIISVVLIISWRLDILFNSSSTMDDIEFVEKLDQEKPKETLLAQEKAKDDLGPKERSKPIDLNKNQATDMEKASRNKSIDKEKPKEQAKKLEDIKDIKVNIPQGSDSNKIADILASSGLISDRGQFLDKCTSMGLETKLKAGDFNIAKGSSLETVIEEITK